MKKIALIFMFLPGFLNFCRAQTCTGAINVFPYNEGFEVNDGNWVMGGTASDWQWGTPAKPVINNAGGGTRCWLTGELAGSSYNNGQFSWLTSPCFDFTALTNPRISFKIFWETERSFDGGSFQYSINGGVSWTQLGNTSSNNNCQGTNWFNTSSITYLTNINGWSGNIQSNSGSCLGGNGSNGWLTATHSLTMLAGQPNVRFRFLFGAGTTCNNFDGFAIDDIDIREVPATPVAIDATCLGPDTKRFSATGNCIASYAWNFGDPASGTGNTSSLPNPQHIFSGPGSYTVTLNTTHTSGPPQTVTTNAVVISVTGTVHWPSSCNGTPDGTITTMVTGSTNPYIYSWSTTPPQVTANAVNLGAGTYSVVVNSSGACSAGASFTLKSNWGAVKAVTKDARCGGANGAAEFTFADQTTNSFQYLWSNGSTSSKIENLLPGMYTLLVTDQLGCKLQFGAGISNVDKKLEVHLGADMNICPGSTLKLSPGDYASYTWQDGSKGRDFTVSAAGKYYVSVVDADGCNGSDTIAVTMDCSDVYFPSAFTPNNDTKNDLFGPIGNINGLQNYSLTIFDRYGNKVFTTNDPFKKWNGKYKGADPNTGAFTWLSSFILNGRPQSRKGTIVIIR